MVRHSSALSQSTQAMGDRQWKGSQLRFLGRESLDDLVFCISEHSCFIRHLYGAIPFGKTFLFIELTGKFDYGLASQAIRQYQ